MIPNHIKFKHGDEILTLWVEREIPPDTPNDPLRVIVGWCPELQNNMVVDARNVVEDEVKA